MNMMQQTGFMKRLPKLILCFNKSNRNLIIPSSLLSFNYFTSKPNSEESEIIPVDTQDVTSEELKTQIDRFYKGDMEAIPTIFKSILKRKLAGKHQDSDDELMNEFLQDQPCDDRDEDFTSDSNSDTDSESDK